MRVSFPKWSTATSSRAATTKQPAQGRHGKRQHDPSTDSAGTGCISTSTMPRDMSGVFGALSRSPTESFCPSVMEKMSTGLAIGGASLSFDISDFFVADVTPKISMRAALKGSTVQYALEGARKKFKVCVYSCIRSSLVYE